MTWDRPGEPPQEVLEGITCERHPCVHIHAPAWFEREDFIQFLNGQAPGRNDAPDQQNSPATWHHRGESVNEFSDVFVTYDGDEGSDADNIPADIWEAICVLVREQGYTYAVVWIDPNE